MTAAVVPTASFKVSFRAVKLTPPSSRPRGGIRMSETTDETILPKAAPMMMPTAISIMLPFIANSLNSFAIPMG